MADEENIELTNLTSHVDKTLNQLKADAAEAEKLIGEDLE